MKEKWTRILVLNLPYFIMFYLVNRGAWLFRHCTGDSQIERLGVMLINFSLAFTHFLPSIYFTDLLAGTAAAVFLKLAVVYRGKMQKVPARRRIWLRPLGDCGRYQAVYGSDF